MQTHRAVVGRRFRSVTKLTTKVRIGRGYLWGSFLIAAAALETPTGNGYDAQGVNLNFTKIKENRRREGRAERTFAVIVEGLNAKKKLGQTIRKKKRHSPLCNEMSALCSRQLVLN